MVGSSRVRLHPWRDETGECLATLKANETFATSVEINFHPVDYQACSANQQHANDNMETLLERVSMLPELESVIIRAMMPDLSLGQRDRMLQQFPSVRALTALLRSTECNIQYLTLMGLPIQSDDLDMNGFIEALRIHPTMICIAIKDCQFASASHLQAVEEALTNQPTSHGGMATSHAWVGNAVVEESHEPSDSWWQNNSFFSWILSPVSCCF